MNGDFKEIFGFVDLGIGSMCLLLLLALSFWKKSQVEDLEMRRYFTPMMFMKFGMGFVFISMYIFYYNGGDNTAYWQGGVKLNSLFFDNYTSYFKDLFYFGENTYDDLIKFQNVGYPPNYIFKGYESWFVCKVVSVVSFLTFRSYLATSLVFTYFAMMGSWRLYELVVRYGVINKRNAAIAALFIPSVGIWCSGITKDSLIYISLLYIITNVFSIFNGWKKIGFWSLFSIALGLFIIYHLRTFIFYVVVVSIIVALIAGYQKKAKSNFVFTLAYYIVLIIGFVSILFISARSNSIETLNDSSFMDEVQTIQNDFINNETYKGQRYSLGAVEFTVFGMLRLFPIAVITAFYRPFILEARSPILLANALESLIFLWFTLKFLFQGNVFKKIRVALGNELLSFSIYFALFLGFIAGFTSIIFGVLVRFRAPILPFLAIVLLSGISAKVIMKPKEKQTDV